MAEAHDPDKLGSKYKAITALLPYAVWQERDGQPEMLDMFLRAARASRMLRFMWYRVNQFASTLLSEASPRALVLASPHIRWYLLTNRGDLVQRWAAATSAVPYSEEVAKSVAGTLVQIAPQSELLPHVTVDVWSWLTKRPFPPPVWLGGYFAANLHVAKAVRGLKNPEILKSYLLLAWSEWGALWNEVFDEICASIRKDFGGTGMDHHRADLIQRLDYVLGQLTQGLEYLKQQNPNLSRVDLQTMKQQYRKLREILLEVERRMYSLMTMLFRMLTIMEMDRISLHHPSRVPIVLWLVDPVLVTNSLGPSVHSSELLLPFVFLPTPSNYMSSRVNHVVLKSVKLYLFISLSLQNEDRLSDTW